MNVIFAAYLGASKFMFVIVLSYWNSEIIHISLPPLSASFISQENELFNAVAFKILQCQDQPLPSWEIWLKGETDASQNNHRCKLRVMILMGLPKRGHGAPGVLAGLTGEVAPQE